MIWWFRRKKRSENDPVEEDHRALEQAEFKLRIADAKLRETRSKIPEITRAARSARIVQHRVDRFTAEISASFRRMNHD